jgi:hypothetical protein
MRLERGRRPYFCEAKPIRNGAHRAAGETGQFRLAVMSETIGPVLQAIGYRLDGRGGEFVQSVRDRLERPRREYEQKLD